MSYKQSTLRSRLYAFYEENKEKGKSFVWHHFRAEGAARATIYRLMGQIDKGLSLSRKKEVVESLFLTLQRREVKLRESSITKKEYLSEKWQKVSIAANQQFKICLK